MLCSLAMATAQESTDSVSIDKVLTRIMSEYPSLLKADNDIKSADEKISLSKTAYLPEVVLNGNASLLGPVTSISLPGMGSFNLFPNYNYNASVTVSQNLYDFGKTSKNVSVDEQSKAISRMSKDQLKQRLSNMATTAFYNLCYVQQAILIRQLQLKNLNEHLDFVAKKASTGSATNYDILTTKVRISATENLITDLQAMMQTLKGQLNTLLGNDINSNVTVKNELKDIAILAPADTLYAHAFANRSEMKIALQKEKLYRTRIDQIDSQNNPSLNAFATGGIKNGYLNDHYQDIAKLNYVVGVSLRVPLFDANRSKHMKAQVSNELDGLKQETEIARRSIANEVNECMANANAAASKVKKSELQLKQASQAYELANVNYQTGTITNLDLLDSYNALSESKLALFKTKIDYTLSVQRLKIALGEFSL